MAGLVAAAHLGPSVVVTIVVVGLGTSAGLSARRLVVLALAILLGQLSIGWSNDWIDGRAGRDAGRADKPTASGAVSPADLRNAAAVSLVLCAVVSLALGPTAAVAHLVAVAGGWAYNAWLKTTPASLLPYVVSFGLLPVIVAATAGEELPRRWSSAHQLAEVNVLGAPWWAVVTAACFGAGVHLANALPDLEVDARTGVRGLPQRLGVRGSVTGTILLLGLGAATVLVGPSLAGPSEAMDVVTMVGAGVVALLLAAIARLGLGARAEAAFKVAMLTGLVVVALLVARGDALA